MEKQNAFKKLKVIELSTHVAGPSCGRVLAYLGANVIKVEAERGDDFRWFGPSYHVPAEEDECPIFDQLNANKRGIVINLKTEKGKELMYKLLQDADIFLTNNRPKALEKNGLSYELLHEKFPRLIYAIITGYGDFGPERDKPGFDATAFWGSSGVLRDLTIEGPGSYPVCVPTGMGDMATGTMLLAGINAALYNREVTGVGDRVSASLYGTAVWLASFQGVATQERYGFKYPKTRYEAAPQPFRTKDGEWIIPTVRANYDKFFPALCNALGIPELYEDPRFTTLEGYNIPENMSYTIDLFEEIFATKTAEEWRVRLSEAGASFDILRHMSYAYSDEQALANGFVLPCELPNGETFVAAQPSLRSEMIDTQPFKRAPILGMDTKEVLLSMGYSEDEIEAMAQDHVVKIR